MAQAHEMPVRAPPFVPPAAPQIPPRRRPAFNPGGFGLTSKTAPRSDVLGLGRRARPGSEEGSAAMAAQDAAIKADEAKLEETQGEGEAEACYVVSDVPFNGPVKGMAIWREREAGMGREGGT